MANRDRTWIADIIQGIFACLLGGIVLYILHNLWYFHWMGDIFGDVPLDNPAYEAISAVFLSLPFYISPIIVGLVAGFGKVRPWWKIGIRLIFGPALSLIFLTKESANFTRGLSADALGQLCCFSNHGNNLRPVFARDR